MSRGAIFLDSFSGAASDLKKGHRSEANVLAALRRDPRISGWDFAEHAWLFPLIVSLKRSGAIKELPEPYPWHRYEVLNTPAKPEAPQPPKHASDHQT